MKKVLFILNLLLVSLLTGAQTDLYLKIRNVITKTNPEIITENKLIAFNVWSVADERSREANKNFEKAYKIYEYAKLKGGLKGMVAISVNRDNLSSTATIVYHKDGISKLLSFKLDDIAGMDSNILANAVFDSDGNEIYKNLTASQIVDSINKLVTR